MKSSRIKIQKSEIQTKTPRIKSIYFSNHDISTFKSSKLKWQNSIKFWNRLSNQFPTNNFHESINQNNGVAFKCQTWKIVSFLQTSSLNNSHKKVMTFFSQKLVACLHCVQRRHECVNALSLCVSDLQWISFSVVNCQLKFQKWQYPSPPPKKNS